MEYLSIRNVIMMKSKEMEFPKKFETKMENFDIVSTFAENSKNNNETLLRQKGLHMSRELKQVIFGYVYKLTNEYIILCEALRVTI